MFSNRGGKTWEFPWDLSVFLFIMAYKLSHFRCFRTVIEQRREDKNWKHFFSPWPSTLVFPLFALTILNPKQLLLLPVKRKSFCRGPVCLSVSCLLALISCKRFLIGTQLVYIPNREEGPALLMVPLAAAVSVRSRANNFARVFFILTFWGGL